MLLDLMTNLIALCLEYVLVLPEGDDEPLERLHDLRGDPFETATHHVHLAERTGVGGEGNSGSGRVKSSKDMSLIRGESSWQAADVYMSEQYPHHNPSTDLFAAFEVTGLYTATSLKRHAMM